MKSFTDKVIVIQKPKEIPPLKKPISFEELKRMTIKHAKETKSEVFYALLDFKLPPTFYTKLHHVLHHLQLRY